MTGAKIACVGSNPCEGSIDPEVLNVQPIIVKGSALGPTTEDFNNLKLMKQVKMKF